MRKKLHTIGVALDEDTVNKVNAIMDKLKIYSRSAIIRLAIDEFYKRLFEGDE